MMGDGLSNAWSLFFLCHNGTNTFSHKTLLDDLRLAWCGGTNSMTSADQPGSFSSSRPVFLSSSAVWKVTENFGAVPDTRDRLNGFDVGRVLWWKIGIIIVLEQNMWLDKVLVLTKFWITITHKNHDYSTKCENNYMIKFINRHLK